jgi:4a-hydroxytetrahydrobiopterin dehydratase
MQHLKTFPLASAPTWTESQGALHREFEFKNFLQALDFINRLAPLCESMQHHPEISWIYNKVGLTLTTHDKGGIVTAKDMKLARKIDDLIS